MKLHRAENLQLLIGEFLGTIAGDYIPVLTSKRGIRGKESRDYCRRLAELAYTVQGQSLASAFLAG